MGTPSNHLCEKINGMIPKDFQSVCILRNKSPVSVHSLTKKYFHKINQSSFGKVNFLKKIHLS